MEKEANSQELYFREDPDSKEARFFPEPGEDMDIGASLITDNDTYNFIWKRSESNLNLTNHGLTHYLTRIAYPDVTRVIEGQKAGNDIVDLGTEEGNTGLLCSLPVEVIHGIKIDDCYKDDFFPLSALLLIVRQKESQSDRIRLITCYPTNNPIHIKWYIHHYFKPRKSIDDWKKDYFLSGSQITEMMESKKKLSETDDFRKSAEAFNKAIEELKKEMEENLFKGYQVFTQSLKVS